MFLAYIDPGTGSQLIASGGGAVLAFLGAAVAALAGFFALFRRKIVSFFKGLFGKK